MATGRRIRGQPRDGLSAEQILEITRARGEFEVLIYHYRAANLRKKIRKLVREKKLRFKERRWKSSVYVLRMPDKLEPA